MKHIRTISRPAEKAYGIGVGHYLLLAGQILGILAMMFAEKPEVPDMPDDTGNNGDTR